MKIGTAWSIFKRINSKRYTDEEKNEAIDIVVNAESHNGMRKDEIIEAFRWFINKGKWISVEDRLPAKGLFVLVCIGNGDVIVCTYSGANSWEDDYGYFSRTDDLGITYWMPLPEPPKGER